MILLAVDKIINDITFDGFSYIKQPMYCFDSVWTPRNTVEAKERPEVYKHSNIQTNH